MFSVDAKLKTLARLHLTCVHEFVLLEKKTKKKTGKIFFGGLELVTAGNLYSNMTCQRSVFWRCKKRRVDADKSLPIPTSAGSWQKSKLSLVSEWKSCDQPGGQVLFLPAEWVLTFLIYILQNDACAFIVYLRRKKKKSQWRTGMNLWIIFGSSEKQVCLPVSANRNTNESANVYEVPEAEPTHSGGNLVASWFSDTPKWTHKHKNIWHTMLFSSPSFCPASCLPLSSFSTLTVESTSRAKLESSCQSKQCFYENIVHTLTMSTIHCTFLI